MSHIIGTESFLLGIAQNGAHRRLCACVYCTIGVMNECWVRHLEAAESRVWALRWAVSRSDPAPQVLASLSDDEWNAPTDHPLGPRRPATGGSCSTHLRLQMHEQDIHARRVQPVVRRRTRRATASPLVLDEIAPP